MSFYKSLEYTDCILCKRAPPPKEKLGCVLAIILLNCIQCCGYSSEECEVLLLLVLLLGPLWPGMVVSLIYGPSRSLKIMINHISVYNKGWHAIKPISFVDICESSFCNLKKDVEILTEKYCVQVVVKDRNRYV